jgi:hypothetical protein
LGDTAIKTDRTTFTENQEFITKSYVDNSVGAITLTNTGTGVPLINDTTNPSFSIRSLKSTAGNDRIDIAIGGTGGTELTLTNPYPSTLITLTNAGGVNTIISSDINPNFSLKGITQGTGITISNSASQIVINNASPASAIAITSTDNNLLTIVSTNPTFSITPKYSWFINFGGNNTTTSAQWMLPGGIRTATMNATNIASYQSISPIASVITWVNIVRTLTTGTCSLAYSINNGTAVVITLLAVGVATNPTPIATNISVPAGATLAMSILSSATSGNCLASLLLRGA